MLCVIGVYLRDITNVNFFFNFALECESSEHLLFFFPLMNIYVWKVSVVSMTVYIVHEHVEYSL